MTLNSEHTWGHTIAFGEEYYQKAVEMLQGIHGEAEIIAEVATRAADAIRAGRKVYAGLIAGHMPHYELVNEREGNPAQFEFSTKGWANEDIAAMQEGDVLLTNRVAEVVKEENHDKGTITVSTRPKNGWAEIRIRDTGPGIPATVQSRMFDPFFTTKEVGRGTGQGLAISHSVIVEKHGGTISIETEMGKGTTFVIRLPVEEEPVEAGGEI